MASTNVDVVGTSEDRDSLHNRASGSGDFEVNDGFADDEFDDYEIDLSSPVRRNQESDPVDDDDTTAGGGKTHEDEVEPKTDWAAIVWCTVVWFFIATILQATSVVAYLYIKQIDSTITPVYAGLHMAAIKSGHAIGIIAFSVYAYSAKCFKKPLLIGRVLSLLSLVLYLSILIFPPHLRRYVFLVAFFAQSMAEGSLIVVRSFVPRESSKKDRQAAYGIINGAMMLSILAGPGIQFASGALPSAVVFPWLQLNAFTYPIWISLVLCTIATVVICTKLKEPAPIKEEEGEGNGSFCVAMATALIQLSGMDKVALGFLFFEKTITSVCFSALIAAFTAFMQTILNLPEGDAMLYIAGSQSAVGLVSILTVTAFVFTPIGKGRASPVLFFALGCYAVMYLYSYPWPPISEPIAVRSATIDGTVNPNGCNVKELPWCATQQHVKVWYWLPVIVLLFGMGVPTSFISLDTVYSMLLGNIDQNLMQGALLLVDDIASSIAPVVTMKIYTEYGPSIFWLVLAGCALVGFLAWLPMIPKMRRLKM